MRKAIVFIPQILLIFCNCIYGRTLTVSNDPSRPAEFSNFATAMTSASNGDTLLVYGSATSYMDAVISKQVVLIGSGINTKKANHFATTFRELTFSVVSNVSIDGFIISNIVGPRGDGLKIRNISVRNCMVNDLSMFAAATAFNCESSLEDMVIENCVIKMLSLWPACAAASNVFIKNSVIIATNRARNAAYTNCIFTNYINEVNAFINGQSGCSFTNCIFNNISLEQNENQNLQFTNCLTFRLKPNASSDLNITSLGFTATGTLINTSPLFATTAFPDNNNPQLWDPVLGSSSPALNSGTGNSQIGAYGGATPFDKYFEPNAVPVVRNFFLQNAVVPVNGTLKISTTVTKAN